MRIAVVHGYFLADSGSGIYVRELVRQFVKDGHDVTLVCQESEPENYDFIGGVYSLGKDNTSLEKVFERKSLYAGSCRLVRPEIHGNLLTYVGSSTPGFNNRTFQEATDAGIDAYIVDNVKALEETFRLWPPDFVQANHAIMQPYETREAVRGIIPYCMTIHGSALNFSVKKDARLVPYFLDGARDAKVIVSLSETSAIDVSNFAAEQGLDLSAKIAMIPPGVDTDMWRPRRDRDQILKHFVPNIGLDEEVALQAGRLLWTKGAQYTVAGLPLINQTGRKLHILLAGDGPMEKPLRRLVELLDMGLVDEARRLTSDDPRLHGPHEFGPVIPDFSREEAAAYAAAAKEAVTTRVHFLGHLPHEQLAPIAGSADISLMPSVFTEAYGLSVVEAIAAGAWPIATYHSGLQMPLDILFNAWRDSKITSLVPGINLTKALAASIDDRLNVRSRLENNYRERLHNLAVEHFSWARTAQMYIMLFIRE